MLWALMIFTNKEKESEEKQPNYFNIKVEDSMVKM
jgi:hypothetical protein